MKKYNIAHRRNPVQLESVIAAITRGLEICKLQSEIVKCKIQVGD